jgi:hypothetical protein
MQYAIEFQTDTLIPMDTLNIPTNSAEITLDHTGKGYVS